MTVAQAILSVVLIVVWFVAAIDGSLILFALLGLSAVLWCNFCVPWGLPTSGKENRRYVPMPGRVSRAQLSIPVGGLLLLSALFVHSWLESRDIPMLLLLFIAACLVVAAAIWGMGLHPRRMSTCYTFTASIDNDTPVFDTAADAGAVAATFPVSLARECQIVPIASESERRYAQRVDL
jgi:hypothetical protein